MTGRRPCDSTAGGPTPISAPQPLLAALAHHETRAIRVYSGLAGIDTDERYHRGALTEHARRDRPKERSPHRAKKASPLRIWAWFPTDQMEFS